MHKLSWVKLVSRMFEAMVGNFAYAGDIQLFLNVVNGALVVHCEDAIMLRFCMAAYVNAAHPFRTVFAINGCVPPPFRFECDLNHRYLTSRYLRLFDQFFFKENELIFLPLY